MTVRVLIFSSTWTIARNEAPAVLPLRGAMSWIEEIEVGEADGKLSEIYAALTKQRGKVSNILKVHSLNPDAMGEHLDLYMTLMFGKSGLSRAEREAIGVVVSANNDCQYCVSHHAEALRRYIDDDETLGMLMNADGLETLEPRLSNIVRHAEKLTTAPGAMTESDLGELRAVDLTDKDILDLTLIVAYFNFVNRIALGLGVTFSADELSGYRDD
jgi:uncharacterized peroxidase-related enzyme